MDSCNYDAFPEWFTKTWAQSRYPSNITDLNRNLRCKRREIIKDLLDLKQLNSTSVSRVHTIKVDTWRIDTIIAITRELLERHFEVYLEVNRHDQRLGKYTVISVPLGNYDPTKDDKPTAILMHI